MIVIISTPKLLVRGFLERNAQSKDIQRFFCLFVVVFVLCVVVLPEITFEGIQYHLHSADFRLYNRSLFNMNTGIQVIQIPSPVPMKSLCF